MAKVEKKYVYNNVCYNIIESNNDFKIYLSDDGDMMLLCKPNDEIVKIVSAEASQNCGYFDFHDTPDKVKL